MYLQHFQFKHSPYTAAPDPRLFFEGAHYSNVLDELGKKIETGSSTLKLVGESGVGKTLLVTRLRRRLVRKHTLLQLDQKREMTAENMLNFILFELNLTHVPLSIEEATACFEQWFQRSTYRAHRLLMIIDDADDLAASTVEAINILSNIEKIDGNSFNALLVGQKEHTDFSDTCYCRLSPLSDEEVASYLNERAKQAGYRGQLFDPQTARKIAENSHGIPREINMLADRALTFAYKEGLEQPDVANLKL